MSSFTITKAKVVNTKNGERLVLESGDDNLKIWMPSTHKDASKLVAGVTVEYETTEKGFHNYKSIIAATPAAPQAPAPPAKESEPPATLEQITDTWLYIYSRVSCLPDLTKEESIKATATVFITASQMHAWADKVE